MWFERRSDLNMGTLFRRMWSDHDKHGDGEGRGSRAIAGRLLIAAVLAAALALAVTACGGGSSSSGSSSAPSEPESSADVSSEGNSGEKVNIGMFLVATANTNQEANLEGAEKAVEEDGNATIRAFNGNFDPATQSKQVEDATATGQYNAFIVDSVDGTQTVPAITKAVNEGVSVVCGFEVCGPDPLRFEKQLPVAAQVSTNYAPSGEDAAKILAEACEGIDPCNVVFLKGVSVLAAVKVFSGPFLEAAKKLSNVHIVAEPEGKFEANAAYEAMKPVIQANPDINVVLTVGDQEAAGAAKAIEESSLKGKGVKIIGSGASVIGTREVKNGNWFATAILRPFNEGKLGAEYAIAAARGEAMSPDVVNANEAPGFPDGYITKENAAKWEPEWAG
jgi:ribose transport system substrate-binding protein